MLLFLGPADSTGLSGVLCYNWNARILELELEQQSSMLGMLQFITRMLDLQYC